MHGRRVPDGRLRITVIGLNYAPEVTGIAPYTTGLAHHLANRGHDVSVITGQPHYPEWRLRPGFGHGSVTDDHGVRLTRVPHPIPGNPSGASRVWMEAVFAWRAGRQLRRTRPDVVITVSPPLLALIPALALRRWIGYRVGAVIQDLYGAAVTEAGVGGRRLGWLAGSLELGLLRRTQGVAVIHDVFRNRLIRGKVPPELVEVVPNWTHVSLPADDNRMQTRAELGWQEGEIIALHAGNMGAKQGLEGLVDVARCALRRHSRVRVVLLGHGSRRRAIEDYADGVGNISILDPLPPGRFEKALQAADCLLLHERPGVVEMSVPGKLTTYFSAGRPVIAATDEKSGAAALMRAARAGVVVPAGDPAPILDAIEDVAADADRAEKYGANGRAYAAEYLTARASLERHEAWVRTLARTPGRRLLRGPRPWNGRPPGDRPQQADNQTSV